MAAGNLGLGAGFRRRWRAACNSGTVNEQPRHRHNAVLIVGAPGAAREPRARCSGMCRVSSTACGDVFQSLDADGLGRQFVECSSKGELVPDELTVNLWVSRLTTGSTPPATSRTSIS